MSGALLFGKPISFEELLHHKQLEPLPEANLHALQKVVDVDISEFNESEVRAYVIDPLVAILGYEKGKHFSVHLEKAVQFRGKKKFPDYKLKLWQEDFWLIEAKAPRPDSKDFGYDELAQALEYACHPAINAALVVLCDGVKMEIYD